MTDAGPSTSETSSAGLTPAELADRRRALIEGQLQVLGRLAEAGLNLALAIEAQGTAAATGEGSAPADAAALGGAALAYARVSRAVRLTVALQGKLVEALQVQDDVATRQRAGERQSRKALADARKAQVERIVERVIVGERHDEAEIDRLADEASERLEHDDIYGDLLDRPVAEIIALICKDLGLAPDWARLAEEAWAQQEIASGAAAGTPLETLGWAAEPVAAATTLVWLEPHAAFP